MLVLLLQNFKCSLNIRGKIANWFNVLIRQESIFLCSKKRNNKVPRGRFVRDLTRLEVCVTFLLPVFQPANS